MPAKLEQSKTNALQTRPPVVVILGHIDHGKTSLLLAIRKLKVPADKPGGQITQHVGAYQVDKDSHKITFIDTPGHEAFSQMRKRGAKVADIAVLVVAADEGVRPQTKEAISHIKEAKIPVILAINKIDKSTADPDKVKRELAEQDLLVESMGGNVPVALVSAKEGRGIEELLDLIVLVAEMENLKTDLTAEARGIVIESYLDRKRGPVATLILSQGKLTCGQIVGTPSAFGKIKLLEDFQGVSLSEALPSQPVAVLGFEQVPRVGEEFRLFATLEEARMNIQQQKVETPKQIPTKEDKKVLNLILKADVLGSLEAIQEILSKLPQDEVALRFLMSGVGEITASDIRLAKLAQAIIIGFRVRINPAAQAILKSEKVKVLLFDIIYDLTEGVRKQMEKVLKPQLVRTDLGKMKVLVVFRTEKNRQIVGGKITEGQIIKGLSLEVIRGEEIVGKGKIINLQKNKKDIDTALKGEEVGILYEGNVKIEVGDILLIYKEEKVREGLYGREGFKS